MKVSDLFPDRDAGRKVEMPQRKSDTNAEDIAAVKKKNDGLTGIWYGIIKSVDSESGVTRKKKWTKYTIVGGDDTAFTTFSKTKALLAHCAVREDRVEIIWERDAYDGMSITLIDKAPEGK